MLAAEPPPDDDGAAAAGGARLLKQKMKVLKQAVREEQAKVTALEAKVGTLQRAAAAKEEEVEATAFNNHRLKRRVEALQQELEGSKKAGSGGSWGLGGMTAGWGSGLSKADAEKLQADLALMQEQLELKIRESEVVHADLFEVRQQHEELQKRAAAERRDAAARLAGVEERRREAVLAAQMRGDTLAAVRGEPASQPAAAAAGRSCSHYA
jgi:DNA repair exonuclease SbcCD ATPase subunit